MTRLLTDYEVLFGSTIHQLNKQICEYLEDDWEPFGSPGIGYADGDAVFVQGMARYQEVEAAS